MGCCGRPYNGIVIKATVLALLTTAFATTTFAQRNQFSIFYTQSFTETSQNLGAAFHHEFTPRFAGGISAAAEDSEIAYCVGGILTPERCNYVNVRTYPIDFTARFQFPNDTRWKPYIGAGLRYIAAPELTVDELNFAGDQYSDEISPEIVGGFDFVISGPFALSVELKGLLGNVEDYDSSLKVAAGLGWRF